MTTYEGGCYCGALRFVAKGPVQFSMVPISFEKSEIESALVGVYTTALDEVRAGGAAVSDVFGPKYHAFYADRLYDITDGKPKFVDMAAEFGGSGKMLDDHGQPA